MFNNPIRMVRELKGAPLSIFFALAYQRTRVSQGWLCGATGYTDKPVQQALAYMAEIGIINHTSAGWQLTRPDAVQLPLAVMEIEPTSQPVDELIIDSEAADIQGNSDSSGGSRNNSDSPLVSLVNTLTEDTLIDEDLTKLTNNGESRKNSDIWEILLTLGVKKNKTTQAISELAWVDRDYVSAMVEKLEGEGRTWPKDCGLLLYRLKQKPVEARVPRRYESSREVMSDDAEDESDVDDPVDASLLETVNGRSMVDAWNQVRGILRNETPGRVFSNYILPLRLLRWRANTLTIAAPREHVEWLDSRMIKTVERVFVGVLAQSVMVEFVGLEAQDA